LNSNAVQHTYFHGPAVDQVFADEAATGAIQWALTDHQGSVRDWVDNTGAVSHHTQYSTFGEILSTTNPNTLPTYAYTGREWDPDAGLYYYRARWYDPVVGRFVGDDPSGFGAGDANLQRYVRNSPTNFTDPSGLVDDETLWFKAEAAAAKRQETTRFAEEQRLRDEQELENSGSRLSIHANNQSWVRRKSGEVWMWLFHDPSQGQSRHFVMSPPRYIWHHTVVPILTLPKTVPETAYTLVQLPFDGELREQVGKELTRPMTDEEFKQSLRGAIPIPFGFNALAKLRGVRSGVTPSLLNSLEDGAKAARFVDHSPGVIRQFKTSHSIGRFDWLKPASAVS
jgi:RHS repeat-associated protein